MAELTGAALRRSLPSAFPAAARGRTRPSRVACARGLGFAEEGHLRYYEAGPPRKAAAAGARGLAKIRAVGVVAGDAAKEKALLEFIQRKDDESNMKKETRKEEKAAMKALKKQQKEAEEAAAAAMSFCEDGSSSSESSESDCEDELIVEVGKGVVMSTLAPEVGGASGVSTVYATECNKAAMKAVMKMEKEQKKAAKKAMKMMKKMEAKKKMSMAIVKDCKDEESSSSSSESSESDCEGEVVRMSRCATIDTTPQQPAPSTAFPVIVPQLPKSMPPELALQDPPRISSESTLATATLCTTSVAVVETPPPMASNRIEVCIGGKCRKSGAVALLQELEKKVGATGAVVGCKCLGKCGLGPNVRLRGGDSSADGGGSVRKNPLYIGVGLEDVGTIVTGLFGDDADLGITPA